MSSIMRARNGLTGRSEVSEVVEALSRAEGCCTFNPRDPKARPSRATAHDLAENAPTAHALPPPRAGSFFYPLLPFISLGSTSLCLGPGVASLRLSLTPNILGAAPMYPTNEHLSCINPWSTSTPNRSRLARLGFQSARLAAGGGCSIAVSGSAVSVRPAGYGTH